MLFNSVEFLIFFPVVFVLYFITPHKYRWTVLLAASYYFYICWEPFYITLIITSTIIDYFLSKKIRRTEKLSTKKQLLILSLTANLGLLFLFKYFNFFNDSLRTVFGYIDCSYNVPEIEILLPVGISFYTFQTLSYTIDIYYNRLEPEKHFGKFALFVSFFPQLVAGPIERATNLLPQFNQKVSFDYNRIKDGFVIVLWGYFQKTVIADRLSIYVDAVYDNPEDFDGSRVWIATYFFAFQILCDFSGYTDIARGCAKMLGFDLMCNFKQPYFSTSITDFWRRWHISLSSWFRDYVYFPMGGNRVKIRRAYINLALVFVISGLWHGASWTFVIWGCLHAVYVVLEKFFKIKVNSDSLRLKNIAQWLRAIIVFHFVVLAWVFFRAGTVGEAFLLIHNMFVFDIDSFFQIGFYKKGVYDISKFDLILSFVLVIVLLCINYLEVLYGRLHRLISSQNTIVRWGIYYGLIVSLIELSIKDYSQFVYFQF
jgi:alginate O-acetyltransferase complex protein AlgI